MLQKVSRRTLLRGLSLGAGILALGGLSGCTQFLKRSESSVSLAPAGASNARQRLAQLAHEAKEAWKSALRAQNKIERVDAAELERRLVHAKHKMLQLLDQLDAEGITAQIDQQLRALPEQFEYPEGVKNRYREELRDILLPEQRARLEDLFTRSGDRKAVNEVLAAGGVSAYIRKRLDEVDQRTLRPAQAFIPLALWPCHGAIGVCMTAFGIALMFCAGNADWCDEATAIAAAICLAAVLGCLL